MDGCMMHDSWVMMHLCTSVLLYVCLSVCPVRPSVSRSVGLSGGRSVCRHSLGII